MVDTSGLGTVEDVQVTLGDPNGELYSTAVIQRALERARAEVAVEAEEGTDEKLLKEAVIALAAWYTYNSSPQVTTKEAADVRKDWDVDNFVSALESDKDDALDRVKPADFSLRSY